MTPNVVGSGEEPYKNPTEIFAEKSVILQDLSETSFPGTEDRVDLSRKLRDPSETYRFEARLWQDILRPAVAEVVIDVVAGRPDAVLQTFFFPRCYYLSSFARLAFFCFHHRYLYVFFWK